jgi:peptidoglycan/xylan/chitin deacetylase (PgdA/CDA1 family)
MKGTLINLMRATGAFAPFRMANRGKALILTYHRFSRTGDADTTSAAAFARQLEYLTANYRIVSLTRLVEYLTNDVRLPRLAVIAIDDGYRDAYEIAFPLLRQFNAPATLFMVTGFVDRKSWLWTDKLRFLAAQPQVNRLEATTKTCTLQLALDCAASRLAAAKRVNSALKVLPDDAKEETILRIAASIGLELPALPPDEYGPITWEQAREMDAAGVEMGSHTVTHPILTRVDDERLRAELCESRSRLEAMLNREIDLFCYPNGDYDSRVRRTAQAAGYRCAVTIEEGLNGIGADLMALRRVHSENNFGRFIQNTSGFEQIKNRLLFPRANRPARGGQPYSYGGTPAED